MRIPLNNFAKGEIAPELQARFDVQAYGAAVAEARNVKVKKYGGLEKRPGTRLVAEVLDAEAPARLIPFQFSFEQAYALELGQGYMRVAAGGGLVLQEELAITDITNDYPARVTAAFHGYAGGDQAYFTGQEGDFEALNGRFFTVMSVIDDDEFTIDFDATALGSFTASTGGITRDAAPTPPPPPPPVPEPVPPPPPPWTGGGWRDGLPRYEEVPL